MIQDTGNIKQGTFFYDTGLTCSTERRVAKAEGPLSSVKTATIVWEELVATLRPEVCVGGWATKAEDVAEPCVDGTKEVVKGAHDGAEQAVQNIAK